jgi:hypothetical protein
MGKRSLPEDVRWIWSGLNALMVRYIVNDVDAAVAFYSKHLRFRVTAQSGPYFAILTRA